jgi:hypothetical protein
MLCPAIDSFATYKIRTVIPSLHAITLNAAEIHRELYEAVYGRNVTTEGSVRYSCRMFKDGRNMSTMKREVVSCL